MKTITLYSIFFLGQIFSSQQAARDFSIHAYICPIQSVNNNISVDSIVNGLNAIIVFCNEKVKKIEPSSGILKSNSDRYQYEFTRFTAAAPLCDFSPYQSQRYYLRI